MIPLWVNYKPQISGEEVRHCQMLVDADISLSELKLQALNLICQNGEAKTSAQGLAFPSWLSDYSIFGPESVIETDQ